MRTERCVFAKADLSILVGSWKDGYWLLTVKWGALGGFRIEEVKSHLWSKWQTSTQSQGI